MDSNEERKSKIQKSDSNEEFNSKMKKKDSKSRKGSEKETILSAAKICYRTLFFTSIVSTPTSVPVRMPEISSAGA